MEFEQITQQIIGAAMRVHGALGAGFLESVYQSALAYELNKAGLVVECERKIHVRYEGVIVGEFCADMLIAEAVLVENKAVQSLASIHEAQLVNYLAATGINVGLLLNFGADRLEFRRKHRIYHAKKDSS